MLLAETQFCNDTDNWLWIGHVKADPFKKISIATDTNPAYQICASPHKTEPADIKLSAE